MDSSTNEQGPHSHLPMTQNDVPQKWGHTRSVGQSVAGLARGGYVTCRQQSGA